MRTGTFAALALQILACVSEMGERFGADYLADVLRGAETARITARRHSRLGTYGALRSHPKATVRNWIEQLEGQGYLARDEGEYPTLNLTVWGRQILRGEETAALLRTVARPARLLVLS